MKPKPDNVPRSKLLGYTTQRPPEADGSPTERFYALVEQCKSVGSLHVAQLTSHPAFREIVSMGEDVVPFLLGGLVGDEPENWFSTLQKITGVDPVSSSSRADPKSMAQDWLRWGQERGIAPVSRSNVVPEPVSSGSVAVGEDGGKVILRAAEDGGPAQLTPEEAELTAARLVNAARAARQDQANKSAPGA